MIVKNKFKAPRRILLKNVPIDKFKSLEKDFELVVDNVQRETSVNDNVRDDLESFYYIFSGTPLKTNYKMISYVTEETDVEKLLKWFNSWCHLECHLVGIAKNEERYIEDWCLWYFWLGIDRITIYDNNDDCKKGVLENLLQNSLKIKHFKNKIEVIPWKGKQDSAYYNYWNNHDFDWLTINDIDEFIQLNGSETNIKALLSRYNHQQILSLKCLEYGDNDIIERSKEDESKPVWEVFTKRNNRCYGSFYKSSFNRCLIYKFITLNGHSLTKGKKQIAIDFNGKYHNPWRVNLRLMKNEPFIKHFRSYSLKEYCQQKLNVRHQFENGDIRRCLLPYYYYRINQRTPEKDEFVRKWRKEHSQNYLFMCSEGMFAKNKWLKDHFCYVFGKPFERIDIMRSDTKFQGICSLITIIDDMDYVVFL